VAAYVLVNANQPYSTKFGLVTAFTYVVCAMNLDQDTDKAVQATEKSDFELFHLLSTYPEVSPAGMPEYLFLLAFRKGGCKSSSCCHLTLCCTFGDRPYQQKTVIMKKESWMKILPCGRACPMKIQAGTKLYQAIV
jgi:hypothetical protein